MFQGFFTVCLLRCRTRLLQFGVGSGSQQAESPWMSPPSHFCWDLWRGWHQMQQIQGYSIIQVLWGRFPVPQAFPKPAGMDHPPTGKSTPKGSWQELPLSKTRIYKQRKQTMMSVDILTAQQHQIHVQLITSVLILQSAALKSMCFPCTFDYIRGSKRINTY